MEIIIEDGKKRDGRLQRIEEAGKEIKEIREEQIKQGNTLTRMEVEHGERLSILMDIDKIRSEKLEEHEKRFERNEDMISKNSDEIFCLKLKAQ